jgi:glycosyltransferase involved in cell wall biosynthesis
LLSDVTVILPAHNEAVSIGKLIDSIHDLNPAINICVGDNNCTDGTADIAQQKGCNIIKVTRQGKGHVVQELLRQNKTDKIIMADADNTYPVAQCIIYLDMLLDYNDVVIGYRKWKSQDAMPTVNRLGNVALSMMASVLYLHHVTDLCSGLWGFRREAASRFKLSSSGFTLEADMFANAVKQGCRIEQIPIAYMAREKGDVSKLKIGDGLKIGQFLLKKRLHT